MYRPKANKMIKRNTRINAKNWSGPIGRRVAVLGILLTVVFSGICLLAPARAFAAGPQVDICGGASRCNTFVETYINPVIIFLTVVVGVAAVISIIMAGIQYASSADDPGTVTKAKSRIFQTVIGLVAYIFFLAFFNYLVPGGFF